MMITRRKWLAGTVAASGALLGCASAPEGRNPGRRTDCRTTLGARRTVCVPDPIPPAEAEIEAKRFEPSPDAFTVHVVRGAWVDAVRLLTVTLDATTPVGTLPRSLIRLRLAPGTHRLSFEWDGQVHSMAVTGSVGEVRFVELAGSSLPLDRPYHWSDADPAGARLRARNCRLVADLKWPTG